MYCRDIPEESVQSGILEDDFLFGYVIEGYQYLTIEDVLSITAENDLTYFDIENVEMIQRIFQEYADFTKPLVRIGRKKCVNRPDLNSNES